VSVIFNKETTYLLTYQQGMKPLD